MGVPLIQKLWTIVVREKRLPWRVSRTLRRLRLRCTGLLRVAPDFIIIGAPKCGTTSLYNYLIQHPDIYPALEKETRYFDQRFHEPYAWYRANFPSVFIKLHRKFLGRRFLTGESTPTYLFDARVPRRIKRMLPHVKLMVLLRDPVDRAFSNYNMEVKNGAEHLSFEDALAAEELRLSDRSTKTLDDGTVFPYNELHFAYRERGKYMVQLGRWLEHFDKTRLLVLKSEDMYADPEGVVNRTFEFLGVASFRLREYEKFYPGQYGAELDAHTREALARYFSEHNAALEREFGVSWGRAADSEQPHAAARA